MSRRPNSREYPLDHARDRLRVAHVGRNGERAPLTLAQAVREALERGGVSGRNHDARPGPTERARSRLADAATRAGHERDLPRQIGRHQMFVYGHSYATLDH